jgi:hypothetical protein
MSRNPQSQNTPSSIPPRAGVATTFVNAVAKQLPSSQEKRGDDKLDQARELKTEFQSMIAEDDLRTIEDKIKQ